MVVEKMSLGPMCTYCVPLNMYRKLNHTTCAEKMVNRKATTALHCSLLLIIGAHLPRRNAYISLSWPPEIHTKIDVPLPQIFCSFSKLQFLVELNSHF